MAPSLSFKTPEVMLKKKKRFRHLDHTCNPDAEEAEAGRFLDSFWLASPVSLVNPKPVRDPVLK